MKSALMACIALFVLSVPTLAADREIALFAGVQTPGKITLNNVVSTGSSGGAQILTDPASVGAFGLRFGHGGVWGGEHTLAFTSSFLDSNSKAFFYNSNLRIQAPLPAVRPYATAGLGTVVSWGNGASDIGTRFAVNYGGGITLMLGSPVGFQADVRGYTLPGVQSQTLNIAQVSLGVVFAY
jgi:hypothetical protein